MISKFTVPIQCCVMLFLTFSLDTCLLPPSDKLHILCCLHLKIAVVVAKALCRYWDLGTGHAEVVKFHPRIFFLVSSLGSKLLKTSLFLGPALLEDNAHLLSLLPYLPQPSVELHRRRTSTQFRHHSVIYCTIQPLLKHTDYKLIF